MPALKAKLNRRGQCLYHLFRDTQTDSNGAHIELQIKPFIDKILCGPVGSYKMSCLACGKVRQVHVGTFCVECSLGSVDVTDE